jgi:pseudomonalisin
MNKLAAVAIAVGVVAASCSGHTGSSSIPSAPGAASGSQSSAGTRSTKPSAVTTAPSGWAATATAPLELSGASDLGALPSSQTITVHVGLQLNNVNALKSAVASGQIISSSTFNSTYAPTAAQVSQVETYLQSQGLSNISVEPNNLIVNATGTAAQIEKAFDTTLESYSLNGATVYANTAAAYVPQSLGGIVVAVLGLNNVQIARVTPHKGPPSPAPSPTPAGTPESPCTLYGIEIIGFPTPAPEPLSSQAGCLRNYRPADYWRAYDARNTPTANGVSIAIMSAGQLTTAVNDVRVNEQADNIPQVPIVVKSVGIQGGPITDGNGEWTLDMTSSSGIAGVVKTIYLYNTTSLADSDIVLEFNHWVTDDLAKIANASFGGCEAFPYLDGSMVMTDEILLQGASQGQTLFASAGDTGSFCPVVVGANGVPAGVPFVNWPAASSYAVGVGGTTLLTDNAGAYQGEAAWYSTGGGISQFEYSPYWQSTQPLSGNGFRGVPDVAMDGDLQTGAILYSQDFGGWTVVGGTSLSSPLAAGVWARMLQSHPNLGYAPPVLYNNFSSNAAGALQTGPPPWIPEGGFHDVTVGCNGLYCAKTGYDYTTGLGSLDISVLNSQL